ncbi:GntP family permease [Staphylococcus caprae]|uniref:GntP family permease n=1 Tax=Staphylococcus caprae TaxID=29380 RepID=UPI000E69086E|nr:GntP family permease [Staphylococcus caprae]MDK6298220.1 GntP family permease [Staphylococcus caprae]MDK7232298.1 GntP family permease [Staphylococcus caprae]RIM33500.1 GntP family permease [Staphylococcus caprae]
METIGTIGIILGILFIIYLAMKGYSILIIGPIASIIVILTNRLPFFDSLIGTKDSYMTGLAGFIISFFGVFLLGSLLAKYMDQSGAAQSIAETIISKVGTSNPYSILVAIFIITAILTYGGISLFVVVFVLVPLAKPLFKELDIAWNLIGIPIMLGLGTFTMTMLPGTPSVQNVVPTKYLGTTLTAAPLLGIIGTIVAIAFGLWYMKFALKKSIAKGETFSDFNLNIDESQPTHKETPNIILSILPIIVLIAINIIGSAFKVDNIILIGLAVSIILSALIFHKYIPVHKSVINEGAISSVTPMFLTASAIAFGTVVTLAPGFNSIKSLILNIPGNPLISLSVASALFGVITGSASGSLGIVMHAFGKQYVDMGIDPEVIHRVATMSSSIFTVMPHTGFVLTFFALTGLNHKNGFKYLFITNTGSNLLALIVVILASLVL